MKQNMKYNAKSSKNSQQSHFSESISSKMVSPYIFSSVYKQLLQFFFFKH